MQVSIAAPTNTVELHARDLDITNARLTSANGQTFAASVTPDAEREIATITLDGQAPAGGATLTLDFAGDLSPSLEGLFLSKDGPDEMLCSQCEATGARAIIPCWDEPTFKATFAWTVTTAPGQTVLTNGKLLATEPTRRRQRDLALRPDQADGQLPDRAGDRAIRQHARSASSTASRCASGRSRARSRWARSRSTSPAQLLPFYEDYFAVALSLRQARQPRRAKLRRGRDGERRPDHLAGSRAAAR